jgi:glutaredoxin
MDETRYEIIAWDGCPWCAKAYDLLRSEGCAVSMVFLERDGVELNEAKNSRHWQTVPMVTQFVAVEDSEEELFIGGYTDLCSHLSEKGDKEVG